MEIIFTFRPLSIRKPMSIINAITRTIQGYPRDHVVVLKHGMVYESTFKIGFRFINYDNWFKDRSGVRFISYDDWSKDRTGTDIITYTVPDDILNFDTFYALHGRKYDNRAAILHLINREEKLLIRANQAINCSELVALMLELPNAWKALPKDVEQHLRDKGYPSVSSTI